MDMEKGEPSAGDQKTIQASPLPRVGVLELFLAFMAVGLSGFGGVLPFVRRMLVERRGWLAPAEFTEVLGLSQLLPGPNVVNISIYVGARFAGVAGAVSAFLGLMLMPMVVVLGLAVLYTRFGDLPPVADAFRGVASAAAGLVVAMAAKIAWPVFRSLRVIAIASLVFIAMVVAKLPLVLALAALAPLSVLWTWWARDER